MIKSITLKIKDWVKSNKDSSNVGIRLLIKAMYKMKDTLWVVKTFLTNKTYRSGVYMGIFQAKDVHQTTQLTCMNRYPEIFKACKEYFQEASKQDIKILSFGCCTGEEVLTLRAYFPNATIVGAELNKDSLKICRQRKVDDKISFIESSHEAIIEQGTFDAVFCMAVLQRTPHKVENKKITSIKKLYPFEKFEKQIEELDEYVKKDGLLVVHITQYDFKDTKVAANYEAYGDYGYSCGLFVNAQP